MSARVAVLQFPGVNCEAETVRALEDSGLAADVFLASRPRSALRDYQGFVLPGGFSYQDRVRAGALAARSPLVETLGEEAERGKPVLGICNGAQVLVEAGLVPGRGVELGLARNRMTGRSGYYTRWVRVRVMESACLFTRGLAAGTVLAMPVAHGEGRFVGAPGRVEALARAGQVPLRYATAAGDVATAFPDAPNGSEASAAAVCNARGNVLAVMPHPERATRRHALPVALAGAGVTGGWDAPAPATDAWDAAWDAPGPGLELFRGLRQYLATCA